MRNSIFLRLSEYKSDPIIEYNKINELIHKNSYCYYGFCDIYTFLAIILQIANCLDHIMFLLMLVYLITKII